ncbi:hypothetical protein MG3_01855 [Candida albicans P78048]|uniref:F-box domain-containing protein n=1 Tax=Candida albicans P78048 TaxID=1094989 RepID=A0AB34PVZ2_CANAX|nr:hypothetical protein MG3_01855 [Candida albicans P78048]
MVIVSFNIDTDLFINLAKLPAEVIALIFSFVPKCMLPELLYCSPIKKVAASAILSYVDVYDAIERHKWSYELGVGYPNCSCRQFRITQENLKQGIRQWKIFPKSIALNNVDQLAIALNDSREFFVDAQLINASFLEIGYHDYEGVFRDFLKSRFKFSCLTLSNHRNPLTLPPIAINVKLSKIKLNSYVIPGVKKLELNVPENQEERLTFSAELEDLIINSDRSIQVTLPPNLQKLEVYAFQSSVHFISEKMVNLEYLTIQLPNIRSFDETGIIAPNLKELNVRCDQLSNLEELRQFQHLKELEFGFCNYPFGLFNEGSFPELEKFRCRECSCSASEDFDNSLLTFPPNLKKFEIEIFRFQNVNFGSLVLPSTLTRLKLKNFPFDYDYLVDSLQYIDVHTVKLTLKSDFRIPHMAKEFILAAEYFSIDSIDFMYHLPSNLTHLSLHAIESGQMKSLAQMVKWPPMLRKFTLINFNIDHFKLKQLNLKESRLTKIHIYQGNVKTLDAGLFPVSVKDLSLGGMGIQQLPDSFENLENLQKLYLWQNQLRDVTSVKLPMATLETLDLSICNLRFISPFLVSMFEEKNKNAKLRVTAKENTNVSVIDIRRALKAIKGLSLDLDEFDKTLIEISKHSSRLDCEYRCYDFCIEEPETDDLYNGSESGLDEESSGTKKKRRNIQE